MMKLPRHECALIISHNDHKSVYETVEQYTTLRNIGNWVSEEEKRKSIETNELWEIHWYPDTPVGFYVFWASDLSVLLDAANAMEDK